MADILVDDLIDLKGHCLVCFRKYMREGDNHQEGEEELHVNLNAKLCKRFLKLIARYLRIPLASLNVCYGNEDTPRTIHRRWETLITGSICDPCKKDLIDPICNLYAQMDYIKMQLQLKVQALDDFIQFANQDANYRNARMRLREKWELEEQDSHHYFKLIDLLKDEISTRSEKMKKLPFVSLKRISDLDKYYRKVNTTKEQPEHRDSVEDSGVSELSPKSSYLGGDRSPAMDQLEDETANASAPDKEYKMMRRVFTCKVCRKKHFSREKLNAHYFTTHHPKSAMTEVAAFRPNDHPLPPERKVFKIRKTAYLCHIAGCDAKFMNKELFLQHSTNDHSLENINDYEEQKLSQKIEALENAAESSSSSSVQCHFAGCLHKFQTAKQLLLHAHFHLNQQCKFCEKVFKTPALLAGHELRNHKEAGSSVVKNIKCPRCSEVLATYHNYRKHFYEAHLGVKPPTFKCSKCAAIFISATSWKRHMMKGCQNQSDDGANESTRENSLSSTNTTALVNNAVQNTNQVATSSSSPEVKKYDCNICGLSVNSFTALQTHVIARHDAHMQFCADCERMFKDVDTLNKHRAQIHLKFKLYVRYCKYCAVKKPFKRSSQFAAHIKAHENKLKGKQPVQECPTCHKKFQNLGSHMRVHTIQRQNGRERNEILLPVKNTIWEKGSVADKIKLNRGRSRSSQRRRNDKEQFDGDTVAEKGQGKRRRRRSKRLFFAIPVCYQEKSDDGSERVVKRKKVAKESVNRNQLPEKEFQSESSNPKNKSTVKTKRKSLSPLNKSLPPLSIQQSQEDNAGESCALTETLALNKSVEISAGKPDKNIKADLATRPDCLQIPQIREKLQKWINKVKRNSGGVPLSSKALGLEQSEKITQKVIEYIVLSDDEEVEDTKVAPKFQPSTCNKPDLSKRVDTWLSSRIPSEEDIITID